MDHRDFKKLTPPETSGRSREAATLISGENRIEGSSSPDILRTTSLVPTATAFAVKFLNKPLRWIAFHLSISKLKGFPASIPRVVWKKFGFVLTSPCGSFIKPVSLIITLFKLRMIGAFADNREAWVAKQCCTMRNVTRHVTSIISYGLWASRRSDKFTNAYECWLTTLRYDINVTIVFARLSRFPTQQKLSHLAIVKKLRKNYSNRISETSILCKLVRKCKNAVSCVDMTVAVKLHVLRK